MTTREKENAGTRLHEPRGRNAENKRNYQRQWVGERSRARTKAGTRIERAYAVLQTAA